MKFNFNNFKKIFSPFFSFFIPSFLCFLFFFFIFSSFNSSSASSFNINSRSYVVIDRNTNKILIGKNENEKRKMASTTKIMTGILIIENCNLNEKILVSKSAARINRLNSWS